MYNLWIWLKRHGLSIAFVGVSIALVLLHKGSWLGVVALLFLALECIRCKGMLRLNFDRSISQSSASHLWMAFLIFILVLDVIVGANAVIFNGQESETLSRTFIDMVSPISLRNDIYQGTTDTATVTISHGQIETYLDSVSFAIPTSRGMAQKAPSKSNTMRLAFIYLAGLIVFSGILVATINRFFATRAERYRQGMTRYLFKRHTLIVGADDIVISLVKSLLRKGETEQIVIMTRKQVEDFRKELFSNIDGRYHDQIVLQYGEQTSKSDLMCLRPEKACEIYIMGDYDRDDNGWSRHDADNITSLQLFKDILEEKKESNKKCYVMFEYQSTFTTFQFSDISNNFGNVLDFHPFNLYEMIAQKTLINKSLDCRNDAIQPLEGKGMDFNSDKHVHLVIVGMTPMGTAMALMASQLCHYPNYVRDKNRKTRITMIDPNADQEMRLFMGRYKDLFSVSPWRYIEADASKTDYFGSIGYENVPWNKMSEDLFDVEMLGCDFVDVEWEFVKGGVEMAEVHSYLRKLSNDPNTVLTVAVCASLTHKAVATGLYLPEEVYDKGLQVLVYQAENDSLIDVLSNTNIEKGWSRRYKKIHAFGLEKDGFDLSQLDVTMAQCVNYLYSTVNWNSESPDGGADYTLSKKTDALLLEKWDEKPSGGKPLAVARWSSIYSANTLWTKLRSVGWKEGELSEGEVELLAEVEHNRWDVEQLIMNYRPRQRRDEDEYATKANRVHPDLKSYDKLDENTKKYDRAIAKAYPYLYEEWKKGHSEDNR